MRRRKEGETERNERRRKEEVAKGNHKKIGEVEEAEIHWSTANRIRGETEDCELEEKKKKTSSLLHCKSESLSVMRKHKPLTHCSQELRLLRVTKVTEGSPKLLRVTKIIEGY